MDEMERSMSGVEGGRDVPFPLLTMPAGRRFSTAVRVRLGALGRSGVDSDAMVPLLCEDAK